MVKLIDDEDDVPNLKYKDAARKYIDFFIHNYPRTFFISIFLIFCSYISAAISFSNRNKLSFYDIIDDNFKLVIISIVPYALLMISTVGIILYFSYQLRDLFLGILEKKLPDIYKMIQSAGKRGILGSKKIAHNKNFLWEYTKNSFIFLIQIAIFIPYVLNIFDFHTFIGIFFFVTLILMVISYFFKFYLSVVNCMVFPIFFMGVSGYLSFHSINNKIDLTMSLIYSCVLTFVYVTTQITNRFDKNIDNSYGFNIMLISICIFPLWKVFISIVFQSLGICYINNAVIGEINTNNIFYGKFIVMETPNKILCRDLDGVGPLQAFDRKTHFIMER